jgi:multisubunit Na+/H+ antiporter MnhG subunit
MSSFFADIAIWLLLALGVGFGALGFFGLLIFPDIRSRMFTASRATLIGTGLVIISVILYGTVSILNSGNAVYTTLVIHTIFLAVVIAVAAIFISRIIHEQVRAETSSPDNKL